MLQHVFAALSHTKNQTHTFYNLLIKPQIKDFQLYFCTCIFYCTRRHSSTWNEYQYDHKIFYQPHFFLRLRLGGGMEWNENNHFRIFFPSLIWKF